MDSDTSNFIPINWHRHCSRYGGSSVLRALVNKLDAQSSKEEAKRKDIEAQLYKKEAEDKAETSQILVEYSYLEQDKINKNITNIKDFLSKNHTEVLKELYENNLIN